MEEARVAFEAMVAALKAANAYDYFDGNGCLDYIGEKFGLAGYGDDDGLYAFEDDAAYDPDLERDLFNKNYVSPYYLDERGELCYDESRA